VICPKCGEDNADNFRFCGMCGAVLERAMPASAPRGETVREPGIPVALSIPANPRKAGNEMRVEPISGPSMLGIGEPTLDSLREKAFSGADPFFEPEEPKTGGRKLLLLVLLAALGAAIWWTYTNYVAIGESQKQEAAASNAGTSAVPAEEPAAQQQPPETKSAAAAPVPPPPSAEATAPAAVEKPPAKASVRPASKPEATTTVAAAKPGAHQKAVNAATFAKTDQHTPLRNDRITTAAPKAAVTVSAADNGEAAFRKGEAYLYGRGVPENCDEAVKNLKAASAKQHARARSTFGTMYATGHCVPRDLPTSYLWFALALRVDPNNQILEKDLSAVWNQMTPPERQLATKMKQ
jgi:hypothetical protein